MSADLHLLTSLVTLTCNNAGLTGTLDVHGITTLTSVDCSSNSIATFNVTGCTALTSVFCTNNLLNQAAVDAVLCQLDANGAINGTLDITLNAVPSAAGFVCSTNLDPGKGWTVFHD